MSETVLSSADVRSTHGAPQGDRAVGEFERSAPANDDIDRVLADNRSQVKDWLKKATASALVS